MMNNVKTKKRALVVDDEPGILTVIDMMLGTNGYEVITTTSGAKAIELVRAQKPDIVLLDIAMPDMTGFEVIERVKAFSRVPIIVFTANPEIAEEAMKIGANDFIPKPFNSLMLMEKIKSILRG